MAVSSNCRYNLGTLKKALGVILTDDSVETMVKARIALPSIVNLAGIKCFSDDLLHSNAFRVSWAASILRQALNDLNGPKGCFQYSPDAIDTRGI